MEVRSIAHWTCGLSGREEIEVEYKLNWFDKLLDRPAVRTFINGPQGWLTDKGDSLSSDEYSLIVQALVECGRLRPSGAEYD